MNASVALPVFSCCFWKIKKKKFYVRTADAEQRTKRFENDARRRSRSFNLLSSKIEQETLNSTAFLLKIPFNF